MIRGAGILFLAPGNQCLFLKRNETSDYPLSWCFPGGGIEGDETPEQAAIREAEEELGFMPSYIRVGGLVKHCVTVVPTNESVSLAPDASPPEMVEFVTFIQRVDATFEPHLNSESIGFAWAPIDQPPQPIHPGCDVALKKFNWNELDIARAIRDGTLASPQQYENMWLFAMRITGTGVAYRKKLGEFVHRPDDVYLNEDFLARCSGLPVIVNHPQGSKLTSKEYAERNVGSVMLPYIKGNEVWAVCRIYDDETAEMLNKHQLSTSPAVVLRAGESSRVGLENGETILFEGDIKLLDHLAICLVGVWDKGKDPSGVAAAEAIGDSQMADEKTETKEEKKDSAKKDAHIEPAAEGGGGGGAGQQPDKMLSHLDTAMSKLDDCVKRMDSMSTKMDTMHGRMDAMEETVKDKSKKDDDATKKDATAEQPNEGKAKELAADKAKKDAAEAEEKEKADKTKKDAEKMDAAKMDADTASAKRIADLEKSIADMGMKMPKMLDDGERNALSDAQMRADNAFAMFGERAPHPINGEPSVAYRRRIAAKLKEHSPTWSLVDLGAVADATAFEKVENQIYADAATASSAPANVPEGMLRAVTREMGNGAKMTRFNGHPSAWMNGFAPMRRYLTRVNTKPQGIQY